MKMGPLLSRRASRTSRARSSGSRKAGRSRPDMRTYPSAHPPQTEQCWVQPRTVSVAMMG